MAGSKSREARAADDPRKVAISEICTLAGCPELAGHYAAKGLSARELTSHLARERDGWSTAIASINQHAAG